MLLSPAELSSMQLDGEVVPLGDSWVHAATITSPVTRVRSLALTLPQTHVLGGHAAAWVHGCAAMPRMLDIVIRAHIRPVRRTDPRLRIRRAALHLERDTVLIAGMRVVSREKAAQMLLQHPGHTADDVWSAGQLRAEAALERGCQPGVTR